MDKPENIVELVRKKRKNQLEELDKLEMEQKSDHNKVLHKIRAFERDRVEVLENITSNLKSLTGHKYSIHKILQESRNVTGLPISTGFQKQAIALFTDATEFINNIDHVLNSCKAENNIDPGQLTKNLVNCTESVGDKVQEAKTCFMLKEALEGHMEFLQEQNLEFCEENTDCDESVFDL